jgi:flagellar motor component MotA
MKKIFGYLLIFLFISALTGFRNNRYDFLYNFKDSCIITAKGDVNFNLSGTNTNFFKVSTDGKQVIVLEGNIYPTDNKDIIKSFQIILNNVDKKGIYYLKPKKRDSTFVQIIYSSSKDVNNDYYMSLKTPNLVGYVNITSINDSSIVGNYVSNITNNRGAIYSVSGNFSGNIKLLNANSKKL